MTTEQVRRFASQDEAIAYALDQGLSWGEAFFQVNGISKEAWATALDVRSRERGKLGRQLTQPKLKLVEAPTEDRTGTITRRFGVNEPPKSEAKPPDPKPEAVEPPEPEPAAAPGWLDEELEATYAEHRRRKLWRVEKALEHLGPKGFDPRKAGAILFRLTEGGRDGFGVLEEWLGSNARAHELFADDGGRHGVEDIYRAAAVKGWRYQVVLSPNRLNQVAEQSEKAMVRAKAEVFQADAGLVRPVRIEVEATKKRKIKAAVLHRIDKSFLMADLARCIDFHHVAKGGAVEPCGPSSDLVSAILARYGNWQFPVVTGIITSPTLRPDGSVLATEGFDPATGLLVVGPLPRMQGLPARPTREDAEGALRVLEELLEEFPFCDKASHSASLSGLITPNVRGMLDCVPLHAATAPAAGTGKSFLWDVCAVIPTGDAMPIMAQGPSLEETEKRLNGLVDKGLTIFSIDNVTTPLGGDCLCQVIERPYYTYRFLGHTKMPTRKNVWTPYASGNNLRIRDDLTRRALLIRMDAETEFPEKRVFVCNPFFAAQENRGRYIAAALTIVRAYMLADRPGALPGIGDPFLGWSDNVRSALVWLGKVDPVETMTEGRKNDPKRQTRMAVLQAIFNAYRGKPRTAGEMVEDAKAGLLIPPGTPKHKRLLDGVPSKEAEVLRDAVIAYVDAKLDAQHFGRLLAIDRNNITDGLVLRSDDDLHNKRNVWRVEKADASNGD